MYFVFSHFNGIEYVILLIYKESYRRNKVFFVVTLADNSEKTAKIGKHLYQPHITVTDKYPVPAVNCHSFGSKKLTLEHTPGAYITDVVSKWIKLLYSGIEYVHHINLIVIVFGQDARETKVSRSCGCPRFQF